MAGLSTALSPCGIAHDMQRSDAEVALLSCNARIPCRAASAPRCMVAIECIRGRVASRPEASQQYAAPALLCDALCWCSNHGSAQLAMFFIKTDAHAVLMQEAKAVPATGDLSRCRPARW